MLRVAQVQSRTDVAQVTDLLREYTTWVLTIEADSDEAPTFHELEAELRTLPGVYVPPAGRLLLATVDGVAAGCVALKPVDGETGELKRLYVRLAFRGQGVGRELVSGVVAAARHAGYRRLILDSHRTMTGAHAIYADAGFRVVDAPADFPERFKPVVVFMEMSLA